MFLFSPRESPEVGREIRLEDEKRKEEDWKEVEGREREGGSEGKRRTQLGKRWKGGEKERREAREREEQTWEGWGI